MDSSIVGSAGSAVGHEATSGPGRTPSRPTETGAEAIPTGITDLNHARVPGE